MRFLILLVAYLSCGLSALAQTLERGPTPDWVDDLPLPAIDPALRAQAMDGIHYILSDHQIRWQGDDQLSYARTVLEVTSRAGLEEAATISIDFDPAFDQLILTRLIIHRGTQDIDLTETVKEEIFRREQHLDEGIIDGTLTAYLQIPDLRVGDVVDHATVLVMKPLVPAAERAGTSVLEWSVPVQLSRTVLLWPKDRPLHLGVVPDRVSHVEGPGPDGTIRHEWQRVNHVPPRSEDNMPVDADPTAIVRFSASANWSDLSAALTPYYAKDYPLPPDWQAKVQAIRDASPDPETRAIAALRLVQDELRYVSLSVGAGGIFARLPEQVIASGFGDCKEKSLLLVVILRQLGIDAEVALTDIDAGYALPLEMPMLGVFDHMIARIRIGDVVEYVDPTASYQGGGFATAAPPDYGFALPLTGPGQEALEAILIDPERNWSTDVTETFDFRLLGVFLNVTSVYRGGAADSMRERWATSPQSQISQDYLEFYLGRYPGLQMVAPVRAEDDRAANRLSMEERYFLPAPALFVDDLRARFPFGAEDFASNLPDRLAVPRRAPMTTGPAAVNRHHIRIMQAPVEFTAPDPVTLSNPAFTFLFESHASPGGMMEMNWEFRRTGAVVPAEQAAAVIADGGAIYDQTWFTWDLTP